MKYSVQTNKIFGKDWLQYHPYDNTTSIDNYYLWLCNDVLKIILQSEIAEYLNNSNEEKKLACVLVSYFEDVISETRLFSTFTRLHKQMYGKELPFYKISDDYYDDEVNVHDIYFLIWYQISVFNEDIVIDPCFENSEAFLDGVSKIYDLFDNEFEKAPQNERLQKYLQLSSGSSDMKVVREKFEFIVCKSFFYNSFFERYYQKKLDKYKKNDIVVLDKKTELEIYDQKIHFYYNEYMPLLSLRVNEYFAEVLGEENSEYQFIKNISKRIFGSFLIRKIKSDGFLIEHLTSKKQIWLSNEFTSLQRVKLVENETVLTLGLVCWKDDVWQNQGGCIVNTLTELKGKDISKNLFDDENQKLETIRQLEKAFLELTDGKQMVYCRGKREYSEFHLQLMRKHAKIAEPNITDHELNETYENMIDKIESDLPFEDDETTGIFFNSNGGLEVYREGVISCMKDKNNPYYTHGEFDLCDLITIDTFSKEFINYIIENDLMNLCVNDYKNPDMFKIIMENLDFLLRFFRRTEYFSKPRITTE